MSNPDADPVADELQHMRRSIDELAARVGELAADNQRLRDELKASLLQSPGLVLADSALDAGPQKSALAVADAALKQHGNDHEPALVLKEVLRRLDMGPPGWESSDMR